MSTRYETAHEATEDLARQGRILLQPPHRIGVPLLSVRDVDAQPVSGIDEDAPQLFLHAEKHLELEPVARHAEGLGQSQTLPDEALVVRGDSDVAALRE